MPVPTKQKDGIATNRARLTTLRIGGTVSTPTLNEVIDPGGMLVSRPGQGGMVLGVPLGAQAVRWESDHLEPGATLVHPDPAANRALQVLSCVGNAATVRSGAAAGLRGTVYGKHGGVLIAFNTDRAHLVTPGDEVSIDSVGVGLRIDAEPDIHLHSCDPDLVNYLVRGRTRDGRLRVVVTASVPVEAAAAGIGMPSNALNIDLDIRHLAGAELGSLAFGDVVLLHDHDHRFGRQYRPGWVTLGVIAHGHSVGGGHGIGMTTLLTGPQSRLLIERRSDVSIADYLVTVAA